MNRSASGVEQAGLRPLEEYQARVQALEAALIAGEESGPPIPFDFDAFIAREQAAWRRRVCGSGAQSGSGSRTVRP